MTTSIDRKMIATDPLRRFRLMLLNLKLSAYTRIVIVMAVAITKAIREIKVHGFMLSRFEHLKL